MKAYQVRVYDRDESYNSNCFLSKEKAEEFVKEKYHWKEELKEKFNFDYDSWFENEWLPYRTPFPPEVNIWMAKNNYPDNITYSIQEFEIED